MVTESFFREKLHFELFRSLFTAKSSESCLRTSRTKGALDHRYTKHLAVSAGEVFEISTYASICKLSPCNACSRRKFTNFCREHALHGESLQTLAYVEISNTSPAETARCFVYLWSRAPFVLEVRKHDSELLAVKSDRNSSCLLYTSPSPRDKRQSRMPSSA